ncbi:hypothetical protein GGX14DRAFT_646914 [Mycena pura]|uniref:Uncharacterized protein n=1 Tax=Mycena pura TaxID=153505 RepID=A0AAD6YBR1_9AGAR|nr:hypothetical protein GGX14DRAFT_646914 [Mycena pura]
MIGSGKRRKRPPCSDLKWHVTLPITAADGHTSLVFSQTNFNKSSYNELLYWYFSGSRAASKQHRELKPTKYDQYDDTSDRVFGDLLPSDSDGIAKALVDNALSAFDVARAAYWAGQPGPYTLEGTWSLATFEVLATTLESKWRLAFYKGQIILYGDPKDVHEEVSDLLSDEVKRVGWNSHPETPDVVKELPLRHLVANKQSSTRKWKLTKSSVSMYCKEADKLFVASTAFREENGLVIEVAHSNESFPELCREIINWTMGDGNRVLLAVGVKRDPQLRLVVRDWPLTPVRVASHQLAEGCLKQNLVPTNRHTDNLILELPIGSALFDDLQHDAFTKRFGVVPADRYLQDLKAKRWILDLGYIRNEICDIIAQDANRTSQEGVDGEEEEEEWSEDEWSEDGM